jgi:type IV pilus assembly protein PilF
MRVQFLALIMTVLLLAGCVTEGGQPKRKVNTEAQVESLLGLGVGYIRNQEYGRAKENLTKALSIDPTSASAHNLFGLLFQLEGEPDLAEDYFQRAIRLDPKFSMARNNYGAFLFEQGRYLEAIEQLEICAEDRLYGARSMVFENLGVSYQQLSRFEAAEVAFTKSLQLNPSQGRALLELAEIRFEQRRYKESDQLLQRYDMLAQPSARSLWLGIRLARLFNKTDDEASQALALKNIFPTSKEYQLYQDSNRKL